MDPSGSTFPAPTQHERTDHANAIEAFRNRFLDQYHRDDRTYAYKVVSLLLEALRDAQLSVPARNAAFIKADDILTTTGVSSENLDQIVSRMKNDLRCYPFEGSVPERKAEAERYIAANRWHAHYPPTFRIEGPIRQKFKIGLRVEFFEKSALALLPHESADAASDLEDATTPSPRERAHINLTTLLDDYSEQLPEEQRTERLLDVLAVAWEEVVFRPQVAAHLLDNPPKVPALAAVLLPLARAGLRQPIGGDELSTLLQVVESIGKFPYRNVSGDVGRQLNLFYARLIRHLAYAQPERLQNPRMRILLRMLAGSGNAFWERFFADLELRSVYGLLACDDDVRQLIAVASMGYRSSIRGTPLETVWHAITDPLEFADSRTFEEAKRALGAAAQVASRPFEGILCLFAFDRILPLYDEGPARPEESEAIFRFFESYFRESLIRRSSQLQHALLTRLLWAFVRDRHRNFDRLLLFEREYAKYVHRLNPLQRTHVQLEYAASLFVAFQAFSFSKLRRLGFMELVQRGDSLLASPLFHNAFATGGGVEQRPRDSDYQSIRNWLSSYCGKLTRQYCVPILAREPLHTASFKATVELSAQRPTIASVVANKLAEVLTSATAVYCAYALSLFHLTGKKLSRDYQYRAITRAIEADAYTLRRVSRFMAEVLWWFYQDDWMAGIPDIARRFFAMVLPDNKPRYVWLYAAAMDYADSPHEGKFIDELWAAVRSAVGSAVADHYVNDTEIFSSEIRRIARTHGRRSRLAMVILEFLDVPDVWKVLGEMVQRSAGGSLDFEKAAFCYSTAVFMGRQNHRRTDRLQLAVLYCRSKAMLLGAPIDEQFFVNAAKYLSGRDEGSRYAIQEFCEVLSLKWGSVSGAARDTISSELRKTKWFDMSRIAPRSTSRDQDLVRALEDLLEASSAQSSGTTDDTP